MRYWAYFAAKLAVAAGVLYGVLLLLGALLPKEREGWYSPLGQGDDKLLVNVVFMVYFLVCAGVLAAIILDQRYRCRVCLRRLRMPIATGSWSAMLLLGRPRIEYICPYGHGTLKEEELYLSVLDKIEWTESGDMWEELCAASRDTEPRP